MPLLMFSCQSRWRKGLSFLTILPSAFFFASLSGPVGRCFLVRGLTEQLRGPLFRTVLLEHPHDRLTLLEWAHTIPQVLEVVDIAELRPR
jgi:hypothetical protein